MARTSRMLRPNKPTVYHVISRSTLPGFPLSDADKDHLVHLLQKFYTKKRDKILRFFEIRQRLQAPELIVIILDQ
jgi:hypothetical protein